MVYCDVLLQRPAQIEKLLQFIGQARLRDTGGCRVNENKI